MWGFIACLPGHQFNTSSMSACTVQLVDMGVPGMRLLTTGYPSTSFFVIRLVPCKLLTREMPGLVETSPGIKPLMHGGNPANEATTIQEIETPLPSGCPRTTLGKMMFACRLNGPFNIVLVYKLPQDIRAGRCGSCCPVVREPPTHPPPLDR